MSRILGACHFPPKYVYKYVSCRPSEISARCEVSTLSHVYTKLVEWGEIDRHPFKGEVRLSGEKPRDRYIEEWEMQEFLSLSVKPKSGGAVIQAYAKLKLLTGMDKSTMLRLKVSDCDTKEGLAIQRNKTKNSTGMRTTYNWTPALRQAFDECMEVRPVFNSAFLFCNKYGESYVNEEKGTVSGFKSLWDRYFARVMKETKIEFKFTERDLRAKAATDAIDVNQAKDLLSHSDSKITELIYRRKPTQVNPLR